MGMKPDDYRIPNSIEIAKERGIKLSFGEAILKEGHPNSALLRLKGESGKKLEIIGESLGGGRINIAQIDGIETNFSGENPTLIVHNLDQPGHVSQVTAMLAHKSVNIATMQLYRSGKGGRAVMVVECDQEIPEEESALAGESRRHPESNLSEESGGRVNGRISQYQRGAGNM